MPILLQLQKLPGKGDGGWKKSVFASFFPWNHDLLVSQKMMQRHYFPHLHLLSLVIFATATVVAFVLLHNSRFSFNCYTQHEATTTQKSARKWHCNLLQLLAWKITKGIHSCKPASLNRPIATWFVTLSLVTKHPVATKCATTGGNGIICPSVCMSMCWEFVQAIFS